jgi:hypothetical protein
MRQGAVSVLVSPKIGLVPPVTHAFSVLTASILKPTEVRQLAPAHHGPCTASDGLLGGRADTTTKIVSALSSAGVQFIDENGGGPGVRLRKPVGGKSGQ